MTHLAFIAFIIAIVHGGFRDSVVGIKYYADAFVPTPIASKSVHHYLCEHGPDNKIIGRQYYYQCGTSSTSSSLASTRTSKQEEYNNRVEKEPAPLTLMAVVSRRQSITLSIATILSTTSVAITTKQQPAHADEPNNLYYKAKADEEDPLAVFSKSLQSMSSSSSSSSSSTLDNTTERSGASSTRASSTSTTNSDSGASSLSFSDIALPSSGDDSGSSSGAGDLGMALQQKKEEQKGRVDPRTHG